MKRSIALLILAAPLCAQPPTLNTSRYWYLTWRIREMERQVAEQGHEPAWDALLIALNVEFQLEQKKLSDACGTNYTLGHKPTATDSIGDRACIPNPAARTAAPTTSKWNLPKRAVNVVKRAVR